MLVTRAKIFLRTTTTTAVLYFVSAVLPAASSGLGGTGPILEVRVWVYDTQKTPDRSDDIALEPQGSSFDYYLEQAVDATHGVNHPADLRLANRIWNVYSDGSTVYRLVFQLQCDQGELTYRCQSDGEAYWRVVNADCNWASSNSPGRRELILTNKYNCGHRDPDIVADIKSGWWLDPRDTTLANAPNMQKDITRIDTDGRLECTDGPRNWQTDAYNGKRNLDGGENSTLIWEIYFIVDDDWTDNDTIGMQLHMDPGLGNTSTDIRFWLQTSNPVLKWVYPQSGSIGAVESSPAIRQGRVYVGSTDGKLYCLDASDGSLNWTYTAGGPICSSPWAAYESGRWVIYFTSDDGHVYAVRDTGSGCDERWKVNGRTVLGSSPAVLDSLLYIAYEDSSLHCVRTSDGSEKWATNFLVPVSPARPLPAVLYGEVYTSCSQTLYALGSLDGTVLRHYGTGGHLVAPVFLTYSNGQICLGSSAGSSDVSDTMYVVNLSNFRSTWKFADSGQLGRTYTSCFSLNDTTVYFGNDNGYLYCINLWTQNLVYKYHAGDCIRSSPLYWNGVVYFGCNNDRFYALDDSTRQPRPNWPFVANGDIESSPAISLTHGLVVVGSSDGHVYGFHLE